MEDLEIALKKILHQEAIRIEQPTKEDMLTEIRMLFKLKSELEDRIAVLKDKIYEADLMEILEIDGV